MQPEQTLPEAQGMREKERSRGRERETEKAEGKEADINSVRK